MMTRTVGITDVAADAGVSVTTVSHALSGNRGVSEATRRRIQESVERLGYRPNLVARGLRLQRTHTVALLVVDISNPYYPALARAVTDALGANGYITFIGNTDGNADAERTFIQEAVARNVDGIIMQPMSLDFDEMRALAGSTPLVIVGNTDIDPVADMVSTLDELGINEGVAHLVANNHTNLAFVSGPEDREPGPARLLAFRAATAAAGISVPPSNIINVPFTRDGGYEAGRQLLLRMESTRPTAIMCANDLIAIGVMDVAHETGLSMPNEVAVIGFDNIDTANLLSPKLTTVDSLAVAVGSNSARVLLERIDEGETTPFRITELATRLVIRQSA
jgi:LacI family transcriptional regulator